MEKMSVIRRAACPLVVWVVAAGLAGCQPAAFRKEADKAALSAIRGKQREAFGGKSDFSIEPPSEVFRRKVLMAQELPTSGRASLGSDALRRIEHWPEADGPRAAKPRKVPTTQPAAETLPLTLLEALQIAARGNRDYQTAKEDVFRAALDLDLAEQGFRNTFLGAIQSVYTSDLSGERTVGGVENHGAIEWQRNLKSGAAFGCRLALDLVKLMTLDRQSAFGILADATVTVPLLRGSGKHIVGEPVTQAQREVVYALYTLERLKRELAVRVASEYLSVLQQWDRAKNTLENYRLLKASARRARRLADAGRLPEIQVDQTLQNELRARDRWVTARQTYARGLDLLKLTLALPGDARIELDRGELKRLSDGAAKVIGQPTTQPAEARTQPASAPAADAPVEIAVPSRKGGGPLEMDPGKAVQVSMKHRLDLRTVHGRVFDAQRAVVVAADALRAGLTLVGTAGAGESRGLATAGSDNARFRPERGIFTGGAILDLPLERTAERNAYRDSYIGLERAVRSAQELEDEVKLEVRNALRGLLQARESYQIQVQAAKLALRRVTSTELFLQAGRAQIRDVLEAQEALVSAQNALTAALVDYRVAELQLQRDMGVLRIDHRGLWSEYKPDENP